MKNKNLLAEIRQWKGHEDLIVEKYKTVIYSVCKGQEAGKCHTKFHCRLNTEQGKPSASEAVGGETANIHLPQLQKPYSCTVDEGHLF